MNSVNRRTNLDLEMKKNRNELRTLNILNRSSDCPSGIAPSFYGTDRLKSQHSKIRRRSETSADDLTDIDLGYSYLLIDVGFSVVRRPENGNPPSTPCIAGKYRPRPTFAHMLSLKSQRCEKPSVLSAQIPLLQCLLHVLFGILPLANLLESVVGDDALQSFQLEGVSGGHDMVVVDHFDEWLDFRSFLDSLFAHATGDF